MVQPYLATTIMPEMGTQHKLGQSDSSLEFLKLEPRSLAKFQLLSSDIPYPK